jgi:hypothetical protein
MTFDEFKRRVSIIQVATSLGYKFDRSKGLSQPSFVLTDQKGQIADRIYIKHPKDNGIQGYWRRGQINKSSSGDLISFVRENLNRFPEANNSRNEIDGINKVLNSFAGNPISNEELQKRYTVSERIWEPREFDVNRYNIIKGDTDYMMNFFNKRNISKETVETFLPFIYLINDKESKYNYKNLAFPYRLPGSSEIVGFEIRGYNNFKSKAEGTDSTHGAWIADFSSNKDDISNIYYAECAYDIMAFYQINKNKINLDKSAFVSTGGSFSDQQFKGISEYYNLSKPTLCFDNDLNGKMYDIRAVCLLNNKTLFTSIDHENNIHFRLDNKEFTIKTEKLSLSSFLAESGIRKNNQLFLWKAPKEDKDWNDVLNKETAEEDIKSRYDYLSTKSSYKK